VPFKPLMENVFFERRKPSVATRDREFLAKIKRTPVKIGLVSSTEVAKETLPKLSVISFLEKVIEFLLSTEDGTLGKSVESIPRIVDENPFAEIFNCSFSDSRLIVSLGKLVIRSATTFEGMLISPSFYFRPDLNRSGDF